MKKKDLEKSPHEILDMKKSFSLKIQWKWCEQLKKRVSWKTYLRKLSRMYHKDAKYESKIETMIEEKNLHYF